MIVVLSTLVAMVVLSWQLTAVSLVLVPLFLVLTNHVGRARRAVAARTQASMADMSATTQETLSVSGILLAKVFDRQGDEVARYREENARLASLQVQQEMTGQTFFVTVQSSGSGERWKGVAAGVSGEQPGEVSEQRAVLLPAGGRGGEGTFGESFPVVAASAV